MKHRVLVPGKWEALTPVLYGFEACEPGHAFGPAVRPYYLIHYVLDGEGEFEKEDGTYRLSSGDIFIIRPGEVTTYRASKENPWVYAWLGFRTEDMPCLMQGVVRQPPVRHIFAYIRDHMQQNDLDGMIYALTYELLWRLSRETGAGERQLDHADYAKTYLDTNYMRHVTIQELADSLHIDRRYLTAQFRKAFGRSPQEYLIAVRMEKARDFLRSGYRVTEAASLAGFGDLANFSRHYKRLYGYNPSQERPGGGLAE